MLAHLFYHIYLTPLTAEIVKEQLGFLMRQPFGVTAVIRWPKEFARLSDGIIEKVRQCERIETIDTGPAREFEFDTLLLLYETADRFDYVGYIHTKGAVMVYENTRLWRNLMNFATLHLAEHSVGLLAGNVCDVVGALRVEGLDGQGSFIAGNFWWARSDYVQMLPYPALQNRQTRYDCELWIGLGRGRVVALFDIDVLFHPISHLAQFFDTDKKAHGYIPFYDIYFAAYRTLSGRLLEIGVYEGESIRLWQKAFPNFEIEGIDLVEKPEIEAKVYVGNQNDRSFLQSLSSYDIVIDGGGHRSREQIISLVTLVRSTKLYVIEDLHTSQPELYSHYHESGELTCLDYLLHYPNLKPDYIDDTEHRALEGRRIHIEQGLFSPIAFIEK